MKKFALLVVSLFAAGSALYARKPAPVIPDFIHAAYSVESLLSEAELTNPGYDAFQFIYLMATPEWAGLDFDRPQDAVDAYATQFDYLKQGGKMALAPSMIEKAHAAGARILLCFGGQQEFLPLLENPDRIPRFVGYMVRLVEKNGYDGIDMDWEITLDKELHARMMALLRERFDELSERTGRYYYLTTALSIDHEYDRALADRLAGAVDWINIMSYDMCDGVWGSTPSHNTSMERMRSKLEHWKVFDKRKLCLGLANYGFYYKGLKPGQKADGPLRDYGSYITYKEFLPRLKRLDGGVRPGSRGVLLFLAGQNGVRDHRQPLFDTQQDRMDQGRRLPGGFLVGIPPRLRSSRGGEPAGQPLPDRHCYPVPRSEVTQPVVLHFPFLYYLCSRKCKNYKLCQWFSDSGC